MDDQVELISDGDGLAVIGDPMAVERFLSSYGFEDESRDFHLGRLAPTLSGGAGIAQAGAEIAIHSGRWMKLSGDSARAAARLPMVKNSLTGNLHATLRASNGQFAKNLQFVTKPTAMLTNPAVLAGAAGIMAQIAMQQAMDEITDYLAVIDEKVDDVIRAQKDAVLADMIGVDLIIEEALTVREQVGRVSEVTWSKVQGTSMTIARTQAYALRQLDALAEKVESKAKIGELSKAAKAAETHAPEWLAVLARCFQLHDGIAVLELDRVLDASPEELDRHRVALKTARQNRLELISRTTLHLLQRMASAAGTANAKVLLHPMAARSVVEACNDVSTDVVEFNQRLGIDRDHTSAEARRWVEAVADVRDKVIVTGSEGAKAAKRATEAFRSVDLDGDGIPDKPRALSAVEGAGSAIRGATDGATSAVGSLFRRKRTDPADSQTQSRPEAEDEA